MYNNGVENKQPLVSVIMPAYNTEKYIGEAIESILNQTFKDYEFIILDDVSTDGTWEIIKKYANQDARIIPIRNEKNLYIAENRNKGVSLAKGKYIVWQDSDDISLPTRIEKQVALMESNPKVGICGAYIQSFDEKGDLDVRRYAQNDAELRRNIFKFSPVAQPVAIVRKEALDKVGPFDTSLPPAEDIDMSFRIGEFYEFANIPEILLRYRAHSQSATRKRLGKMIGDTLEIRKRYKNNPNYYFVKSDYIAYTVTYVAKYMPAMFVIPLFKLSRSIIVKKYLN